MLDLDNITQAKTKQLAAYLCKRYKLEGYLIVKSSKNHYHLIFNRYLKWRKALQVSFQTIKCVEWAIWQARKGEFTLRISCKNGKNKPQIIYKTGKQNKLIKDYLEVYELFKKY